MPATAAIISRDGDFISRVAAVLAGGGIQALGGVAAATGASPSPSLAIVDGSSAAAPDFAWLTTAVARGTQVIAVTAEDDTTIALLRSHPYLNCVLGKRETLAGDELLTMALGRIRRQPIGIEACLEPQADIRRLTLTSYDERELCFTAIHAYMDELRCFPDFPELIVSVVWEMLMNALIDAPARAGRQGATGADAPQVHVRYGSDQRHVAISVADAYGSLTRDKVVEALERCHRRGPDQIREGPGGAGIGLYMLFNCATQLHFSIRPGVCTDVILVTPRTRRYKDFSTMRKTINLHFEEAS